MAGTAGLKDHKQFFVFETFNFADLPEEQQEGIMAHEVGHIYYNHSLLRTSTTKTILDRRIPAVLFTGLLAHLSPHILSCTIHHLNGLPTLAKGAIYTITTLKLLFLTDLSYEYARQQAPYIISALARHWEREADSFVVKVANDTQRPELLDSMATLFKNLARDQKTVHLKYASHPTHDERACYFTQEAQKFRATHKSH